MLCYEQGYILPFVMAMILIISALITHQISLLGYEDRVLMEMVQHEQDKREARAILQNLAVENSPTRELPSQASYVVEWLMNDNCAILMNNQPITAQYSRITLRYQARTRVVMQASAMHSVARIEACKDKPHKVQPGIQWLLEM